MQHTCGVQAAVANGGLGTLLIVPPSLKNSTRLTSVGLFHVTGSSVAQEAKDAEGQGPFRRSAAMGDWRRR